VSADPMNSSFSTTLPPPVTWTGHDMIVLRNDGGPMQGGATTRRPITGRGLRRMVPRCVRRVAHLDRGKSRSRGAVQGAVDFRRFVDVNTGRRYDPWTDSWTPTSTSRPSLQRSGQCSGTGNEMVVWGGRQVLTCLSQRRR
jgi:hypothetical protein